jgi:hypothetical protein
MDSAAKFAMRDAENAYSHHSAQSETPSQKNSPAPINKNQPRWKSARQKTGQSLPYSVALYASMSLL